MRSSSVTIESIALEDAIAAVILVPPFLGDVGILVHFPALVRSKVLTPAPSPLWQLMKPQLAKPVDEKTERGTAIIRANGNTPNPRRRVTALEQ
jgi:hypothetical protein